MQAAGYALRISCATPLLSSALGMAGIGFSSVLAGEASRRFGAQLTGKRPHRSAQAIARDVALDALLGMSLYKVPACPSDTLGCSPPCWDCRCVAVLMPIELSTELCTAMEGFEDLAKTSKQKRECT